MINKIFLVGFRTTGKSTFGKILAEKLDWSFYDCDFLITQQAGEQIDNLTKNGTDWKKFRHMENELLKDVIEMQNVVISCGGGVGVNDVIDDDSGKTYGELNRETLKNSDNSLVILLTSKDEITEKRLYRKLLNKRILPLINGGEIDPGASEDEQIKLQVKDSMKALQKRKSLYELLGDLEIDTSDFILPKRLVNLNAVIGDPVSQSLSPKMHQAGYKALEIDDLNLFMPIKVTEKNLERFVEAIKILGINGVSVTLPHKESIIKYLDEIDETAKIIGAVNTIVNREGKLYGFNTDWSGAMAALEKHTDLKNKKAVLFGGGGAARAMIYGLLQKGAEVTLINRDEEKAKSLAQKFKIKSESLDNLIIAKDADIIINCTSVGMFEEKSLIPEDYFNENQIVFDIITSPKETKLIKNAKSKSAKVVYGYEMLLYQGVEQFKLFTNFEAPDKEMEDAIKND